MAPLHTRIAPTPSGYLHLGNAFNFLFTEALARHAGGILSLRIDDLDAARVRPEYLSDIFESLSWLGIAPDSGAGNPEEHTRKFSQKLRLKEYDLLLQQLVHTGLVFACNCSRKKLAGTHESGQYPGTCLSKKIPLDTPDVAWRLYTPNDQVMRFEDALLGPVAIRLWDCQRHFVVRRRDGLPAYQIASLHDDVQGRINTLVRGADLLSSTAAQLYLATLLGLEEFQGAQFFHHPLLCDAQGQKLSKSAGSSSLKQLRAIKKPATEIREEARAWYASLLLRHTAG